MMKASKRIEEKKDDHNRKTEERACKLVDHAAMVRKKVDRVKNAT